MDHEEAIGIIEGILFASGDPLKIEEIAKTLDLSVKEVEELIDKMQSYYKSKSRGIMVSRVGSKVRITTKPEIYEYIEKIHGPKTTTQLSKAALETLAIIMFKQPITKTEIEAIRGVNVEKALNGLQEKNLIMELGRKDTPGRPILYGITDYCLEYFGIGSIEQLKKNINKCIN